MFWASYEHAKDLRNICLPDKGEAREEKPNTKRLCKQKYPLIMQFFKKCIMHFISL